MKRSFILIAITLFVATAALAQPRPAAGGPGAQRGPGAGITAPGAPQGDPLANYLQLNDAQKSEWTAAHQAFADSTKATRDAIGEAQEDLRSMLDSGSTDATAIGNIMLSIRGLNDQIRSAHQALQDKLESILTAEQKVKMEAFKAASEFLRQRGSQGGPGGPQGGPRG